MALFVVLDRLTAAERVAFVLHNLFDLPFEEIAPIVGRTPAAARQLASRARRRVQGAGDGAASLRPQRGIVDAFLAAARAGSVQESAGAARPGRRRPRRRGGGADGRGAGGARRRRDGRDVRQPGARGAAGDGRRRGRARWAQGGVPRVAFAFTIADGRIAAIELVADAARLAELAIVLAD